MHAPDPRTAARLRRAYEGGRLRAAAIAALPLAPLVLLAASCCSAREQVYGSGAALLIAVIALRWRGEEYGAGVAPGLVAGLAPMLIPVATRLGLPLCHTTACDVTASICALGGLAGGVALGFLAPHPGAGRSIPFLVACLVAGLAGAVGCLMYGFVGLAVMAGGLAIGALPLWAVRRA